MTHIHFDHDAIAELAALSNAILWEKGLPQIRAKETE
jgi:hypothetical protein